MIYPVMRFAIIFYCLLLLSPGAVRSQGNDLSGINHDMSSPDAQSRYMPWGPAPEEGYQSYEEALDRRAQVVIAGVPAYLWRHGCGPTAAGMAIGYWDGNGYSYLVPGDATTQTNNVDQAIATGDGASTHYSDYSQPVDYYPLLQSDLSELPVGDEHASCCLGDFMATSFSSRGNYYGWSWYGDVDHSLEGYVAHMNATAGTSYGCNAWNESWGAFTWADFMGEIDNGRPMVFLVDSNSDGITDHFVTAIGYRDENGYNEYACFDTWSTSIRWERFREMSSSYRWGIYGATFCVMSNPDATNTIEVMISSLPVSGYVPFTTTMFVQFRNLVPSPRTFAGSITASLANGQNISNWRSGYTNVMASDSFSTSWAQYIPAISKVIGDNTFTLYGYDVTPSPFNQPPYAPAGDTDNNNCVVTGMAP